MCIILFLTNRLKTVVHYFITEIYLYTFSRIFGFICESDKLIIRLFEQEHSVNFNILSTCHFREFL